MAFCSTGFGRGGNLLQRAVNIERFPAAVRKSAIRAANTRTSRRASAVLVEPNKRSRQLVRTSCGTDSAATLSKVYDITEMVHPTRLRKKRKALRKVWSRVS